MNLNNNKNNSNKPKKPIIYYYAVVMLVLAMLNLVMVPFMKTAQIEDANYSTFVKETNNGNVKEVQEQSNQILYMLKDSKTVYRTGKFNDPDLMTRLEEHNVDFTAEIVEETSPFLQFLIGWIIPIFFATLLLRSMMARGSKGGGMPMGGNMFGIGKSNARVYDKNKQSIRFSDVAGEDEAKESLQEIVTYLKNPGMYKDIGATMPKGILLVGPPGTGKTMLAKAVAGESNVPFFSISGSEFVELFVGMGASKVRDLFKQAKEKAPCIVFIDEIDAIGGKRNASGMGGNDEREQTLNQLLTEMDGFEGNSGVIILAEEFL